MSRYIKWGLGFLAGSMGVSLILFGLLSPQFQCRLIVSNPTAFISNDAFKAYVKSDIGRNVFVLRFSGLFWLDGFKERFQAAFPAVESLDVSLVLPDVIQLTIKEKEPWISCKVEGETWCLSADGTVLNAEHSNADLTQFQSLPIVQGLDRSHFRSQTPDQFQMSKDLADTSESDEKDGSSIGTFHNTKNRSEARPFAESDIEFLSVNPVMNPLMVFQLNEMVSHVNAVLGVRPFQLIVTEVVQTTDRSQIQAATLLLDDTIPVYLAKLDRLKETLAQMKLFLDNTTRPISYIDLRVQGRIIVRYGN